MVLEVKDPPANARRVRDSGLIPGFGDPLEEKTATHSSILAWKIPWTEKPGGLQSMRSQRVGHNLMTKQHKGPNSGAARWKTCAGRRLGKDVELPPCRCLSACISTFSATRMLSPPLYSLGLYSSFITQAGQSEPLALVSELNLQALRWGARGRTESSNPPKARLVPPATSSPLKRPRVFSKITSLTQQDTPYHTLHIGPAYSKRPGHHH